MRVAVVGGGIFGCTAAIHAARAGFETHLIERADHLLGAASSVNQFRLHRGYHYPRSPETGRACRYGNRSFFAEYGEAVIGPQRRKRGDQVYAIAAEGSRISGEDYLAFCNAEGLPYRRTDGRRWLDRSAIKIAVSVLESVIDPHRLDTLVWHKLGEAGVHVHLEASATPDLRNRYDRIVIAAYAETNKVASLLGCNLAPFQYEIVEKPVVRMPADWRNTGVVVMDGPFCSVDPYGWTGQHLLGHVEHEVHHRSVSVYVDVPEAYRGLLNAGVVMNARVTNFEKFVEFGSRYVPALREAAHVGSMFTVRTVLTDERPTLVEALDEQVIRIFSGKIGTCVDAAHQVVTGHLLGRRMAA